MGKRIARRTSHIASGTHRMLRARSKGPGPEAVGPVPQHLAVEIRVLSAKGGLWPAAVPGQTAEDPGG